uniref:Cell division protein ZapB n=1 Tax=candidate division WOR-3 bacterium TaxID=2052148 RepID=A0A7C4YDJ2_UNCW3
MKENLFEVIERVKKRIKDIKEENVRLKEELKKEREAKEEALKKIDELINKLKNEGVEWER